MWWSASWGRTQDFVSSKRGFLGAYLNHLQKWLFRMIMASEGQFSELLLDQTYRVISNPIVFVYKASKSFVSRYV